MASVVAPLMRMTNAHETRHAIRRATSSPGAENHLSLNQTLWRAKRFWLQVVDMASLVNRTFPYHSRSVPRSPWLLPTHPVPPQVTEQHSRPC